MGTETEVMEPFVLEREPHSKPKRRARRKTVMPFGKYKGWPLDDIPLDYLEWADDSLELKPYLRRAIQGAILRARGELPG